MLVAAACAMRANLCTHASAMHWVYLLMHNAQFLRSHSKFHSDFLRTVRCVSVCASGTTHIGGVKAMTDTVQV